MTEPLLGETCWRPELDSSVVPNFSSTRDRKREREKFYLLLVSIYFLPFVFNVFLFIYFLPDVWLHVSVPLVCR